MVRMNSRVLAVISLAAFILGIGGSMLFGLWQTESSKVPATISEGEFAGLPDPGDIRGSYSFADIRNAFGVPVEDLARAFGVEPASGDFLCKELEDIYTGLEGDREVGTDSVRLFVAVYLGLPHTPEDTTALPAPAFAVLQEQASPDPEVLESLRARSVPIPAVNAAEASPVHTAEEEKWPEVKGNTTFGDLTAWGLSTAEIEAVLGLPAGAPGVTVRDYLNEQGREFVAIKAALQEKLDKR